MVNLSGVSTNERKISSISLGKLSGKNIGDGSLTARTDSIVVSCCLKLKLFRSKFVDIVFLKYLWLHESYFFYSAIFFRCPPMIP